MKKLFCLLLALLTIGGCALAETENKTDEAVLNIFTWEGYIDYSTVIKPFEDETGIKVNYATFSSNEEMYEKLSAVNGGDYDVVLASDYMLNTTREAGLMQPFDPAIVDNYSNLNEGFTHQFFDPDDQYVVPYVSGIPLIVYDPSAVEIDIKGFNDLWDPSLEDSLGLIDDARVTIGMVLLSMHQSMNTTDDAVLAEGGGKARRAARQHPRARIREPAQLSGFRRYFRGLHLHPVRRAGAGRQPGFEGRLAGRGSGLRHRRLLHPGERAARQEREPLPPVPAAPGSRGDLRRVAVLLQPERGGEGLPLRKLPEQPGVQRHL